MEIKLKNHIKSGGLGTRDIAFEIRKTFEGMFLESSETLVFDFEGVGIITQSSIDELIGVFITNEGEKIIDRFKFKNCTDAQKEVILFVISDRLNRLMKLKHREN